MKLTTFISFLFVSASLSALPERHYQDIFAAQIGGLTEVTAGDGTRCDILTDSYAIEVDFARKWGEAIGQSLNYGFQFNRPAGIVLILEKPSDRKHLIRVNSIIQHYDLPIKVWEMRAYEQSSEPAPDNASTATGDFWISSTGKTHKQGCRYYGKGNGRHAKKASGNDCKICGGSKKLGNATTSDDALNSSGVFWISTTGKTHKEDCSYYGKGNGRYDKQGSGDDCRICDGAMQ